MRVKCKLQTTDRLSQVCLVCIWKTSWMWHRVRTSGIVKFICFVLNGFVESLWHVVTVRLDYRKTTTMKQLTDKETSCRSVNNELNSVWCVQFVMRLWKEFPRGPFLAPCCFKIFSWTICTKWLKMLPYLQTLMTHLNSMLSLSIRLFLLAG